MDLRLTVTGLEELSRLCRKQEEIGRLVNFIETGSDRAATAPVEPEATDPDPPSEPEDDIDAKAKACGIAVELAAREYGVPAVALIDGGHLAGRERDARRVAAGCLRSLGCDTMQIAAALGVSESTVRDTLARFDANPGQKLVAEAVARKARKAAASC